MNVHKASLAEQVSDKAGLSDLAGAIEQHRLAA